MRCNSYTRVFIFAGIVQVLYADKLAVKNAVIHENTKYIRKRAVENRNCGLNQYTCQNGECVTLNARCNRYVDCQDLSDEINCPQVTPSIVTRVQSTYSNPQILGSTAGCILPEQPSGGSFEIGSCETSHCSTLPGTRVPLGSFLTYRCNDDYNMQGNNVTVCNNFLWDPPPTCIRKYCPALKSKGVNFECKYQGKPVSCESEILPWTIAALSCKIFRRVPFNEDLGYREITCLEDGVWNRPVFNCTLECGTAVDDSASFLVNGSPVKHHKFPWFGLIYKQLSNGLFLLIQGGTLISPDLMMCSAWAFDHRAVGKVFNATSYAVTVGKISFSYNVVEPYAQTSRVSNIYIAKEYDPTYLVSNIALLRVETPFTVTALVKPICIDWDDVLERESLASMTRNKNVEGRDSTAVLLSNKNQETTPLYISNQECLARVVESDRPYLGDDKFCIGCGKGSSRCTGDGHSGGFGCEFNGLWYLLGFHSTAVSARESSCEGLEVFTSVRRHLGWIYDIHISRD